MNHNILLIGSEQLHAEVFKACSDGRHSLLRAANPKDARRFLDQTVDLIICDLSTTPLDAFELIREWGRDYDRPPFILLVDAGDMQSAIEGMKLGAMDCLVKPLDPENLRSLVDQAIDARAGRAKATSANGSSRPTSNSGNNNLEIPEGTSLEDLERAAVEKALQQHHGNRTHAARELGISVRTLQRKLKAWRLPILSLHHFSAGSNGLHVYD
jgi:DNA-binding NtrC family response regulator